MDEWHGPNLILVADDDADDRMMIVRVLVKTRLHDNVTTVRDGHELIEYLCRQGAYTNARRYPIPGLILLDLNMPRLDGREALKIIKSDPVLRRIPVVVFTTSGADEDVRSCYDNGANAFVTKPVTYTTLLNTLSAIIDFWLDLVRRPEISEPIKSELILRAVQSFTFTTPESPISNVSEIEGR